jgi:Spy/CpxP family protein refolding chaperone
MKTLGITTLAVAVLAAGSTLVLAQAQGPGGPGRRGPGQGQGRIVEYLGLTDEQQATWKSLHEQHRTEIQPLREEGRELFQRLKAATEAENPDPATVGAATLALKQHRDKMKAAREAFEAQLTSVLTPDQKAKFEAFKAAHPRGEMRGGHRGHRGPGPDGPEQAPGDKGVEG